MQRSVQNQSLDVLSYSRGTRKESNQTACKYGTGREEASPGRCSPKSSCFTGSSWFPKWHFQSWLVKFQGLPKSRQTPELNLNRSSDSVVHVVVSYYQWAVAGLFVVLDKMTSWVSWLPLPVHVRHICTFWSQATLPDSNSFRTTISIFDLTLSESVVVGT